MPGERRLSELEHRPLRSLSRREGIDSSTHRPSRLRVHEESTFLSVCTASVRRQRHQRWRCTQMEEDE